MARRKKRRGGKEMNVKDGAKIRKKKHSMRGKKKKEKDWKQELEE